ncbi:uncharacterized protein PV09_06721 [Verruconis gallopava]|uniref:DH domain-containing protein n=1 Tax=Verruconis gallopava TaxID=253628 RepID=A0A0D1YM27_9PEZI|nr:uncharacterized protein PV09_06721 [Verruconis gallopava]KIW01872.1 hypothetical protein PV09_06721 [Verruconis gallopava]
MVVVVAPPPSLSPDVVTLFYVVDDLLARSPILIFYGPSSTPTAAANNSRIQAHVFTAAGFQSYPRLTVSPSSPLYSAVNCLPREEQGDDICRGLAYSLFKYFSELPANVKQQWEAQSSTVAGLRSAPTLFSDAHAAIIAQRMVKVDNLADVISDVRQALAEQSVSWLDVDVVMPPGSMKELDMGGRDSILPDPSEEDVNRYRFGEYAPIVELFGEAAFLPTSRIKRRPSKPTLQNRNGNFTRAQKESVRREFCELLDTEENYVGKLYDLVHSVAADFREKAKVKSPTSSSPSAEALEGLFPPSLDEILKVNSAFLDDLRRVVEETENDAINDIENTPDGGSVMPQVPSRTDVTGTLSLAACMRSWFPQFAQCYTEYTKAHSQMSYHLRQFMRDAGSSFSQRMQETGEQRLMSMLIEPVQRLPRYNLYIDNILKQLPARHAAVKGLLKARDLISDICSHDVTNAGPDQIFERLQSFVAAWPLACRPTGRLITAVDAVELAAPYRSEVYDSRAIFCIMLLFTDQLVVLRKTSKQVIAARGFLAQLDGTDVLRNDLNVGDLVYKDSFPLSAFDVTEMNEGKQLQLILTRPNLRQSVSSRRSGSSRPGSPRGDACIHVYHLGGSYESKASRFMEELVKARVEGRFTEAERESPKWEVHSAAAPDLSLFSAVFEDRLGLTERPTTSRVRIVIDPIKHVEIVRPGQKDVEIAATLTTINEGFYKLDMVGANDFVTKDHLTAKEFLPVLAKRLNNFLQMQSQIKNPALVSVLLQRNQTILQSLNVVLDDSYQDMAQGRSSRSQQSPVKLLSSIFGGSINREPGSLRKHNSTKSESGLGVVPQFRPPQPTRRTSRDLPSKPSTPTEVVSAAADALAKLEQTLSSYILALQARKGNIVGRVLRMRGAADELTVNELYNALLEDPTNYEIVAQASVDVLFCAFEKFVKIAWHDRIGPIISPALWKQIQAKLDTAYPSDFEDFFRGALSDLSPQNQRAFRACVKLLVELLEGTGNDGDRGMITASFAEVLVPEGDPADFVSVLDRLVEDVDPLLDNSMMSNFTTPHGSVSEATVSRHRNQNSISLSSNTSLRKKFGLSALTRKTSKRDEDEKTDVGSVWRALSKSKSDDKSGSMSKAAPLTRSNSTDVPTGFSPKRPVSRDRPTVLGAFNFENSPLATIGESVPIGPPRKKRRSSLSDLATLQASAGNTPSFVGGPTTPTAKRSFIPAPSPATPSPSKPSLLPAPIISSGNSPPRREGSPSRALPRPLNVRKNSTPSAKSDEVAVTPAHTPGHRRAKSSVSGIPKLRTPVPGLSERPNSANVRKLPPQPAGQSSPEKPVMKLRMQSPQKLRERVQNNQKIFESAGAAFQEEIAKITEEINSSRRPASVSNTSSLEAKVAALADSHASMMADLTSKLEGLSKDIDSSLQVSESRYKKLDDLWKETSAENEALYSRFNEELAKLSGQIRRGEGIEELRKRFVEVQDENARLRKENQRLRRENVGLKAQLRE